MDKSLIGKTISHYRITSKIGEGGMGVVYKAIDTTLKRKVAIKFLSPDFTRNSNAKRRFIQEAQAASVLDHPNICTVHEINETDKGQLFIVMAFYEGSTLKRRIDTKSLSNQEAINISIKIAKGLSEAHEHGIIHRDIKPENIFLTNRNEVKILDFGIARMNRKTRLTTSRAALGTIAYMSPEQLRTDEVDQATDIWSLGVLLFEMLCGNLPFNADYEPSIIYSIIHRKHKSLKEFNSDVSKELNQIVDKMLQKNSGKRYQSMMDVIEDLININGAAVPKKTRIFQLPDRPIDAKLIVNTFLIVSGVIIVVLSILLISNYRVTPINSILILPLDNINGDTLNQEYLGIGITDAIIGELAQIKTIRVISRHTAAHYKDNGTPIRQISRQLHVDAVVEGNYLLYGDSIRISTILIDARRDRQISSQVYEHEVSNILRLYGEIATEIAAGIRIELSPEETSRLASYEEIDPGVNENYLKGRYNYEQMTTESLDRAVTFYNRAINLDSSFAPAYAGLAETYYQKVFLLGSNSEKRDTIMFNARNAARHALELDKELAESHIAAGLVQTNDWNWQSAEYHLKKAIEIKPNSVAAHRAYSELLMLLGRFREALAEIEKAEQLDPVSLSALIRIGWIYWFSGNYDKALVAFRSILEVEPKFAIARYNLGLAYLMIEMYSDAIIAFENALDNDPENMLFLTLHAVALAYSGSANEAQNMLDRMTMDENASHDLSPYLIALLYNALGEDDEVFFWLSKAFVERDPWMGNLKIEQLFKNIHSDPRYQKILMNMNLI